MRCLCNSKQQGLATQDTRGSLPVGSRNGISLRYPRREPHRDGVSTGRKVMDETELNESLSITFDMGLTERGSHRGLGLLRCLKASNQGLDSAATSIAWPL